MPDRNSKRRYGNPAREAERRRERERTAELARAKSAAGIRGVSGDQLLTGSGSGPARRSGGRVGRAVQVVLGAATVVALLGSSLAIAGLSAPEEPEVEAPEPIVAGELTGSVPDETSAISVGAQDAAVVMDVVTDFECLECATWEESYGQAVAGLVSAGTLRVRYHPSARFGQGGYRATQVAACANTQGVFAQVNTELHASQRKLVRAGWSREALLDVVEETGIRGDAVRGVRACVEDGEFAGLGAGSSEAVQEAGVGQVPAVFVEGERVDSNSWFDAVLAAEGASGGVS